jgi:Gpi18-like mannosyltransferase
MTTTPSALPSNKQSRARHLNHRHFITSRPVHYLAIGLLFLAALVVRVALFHIVTGDYTMFLSRWYDFIKAHGGFAAMQYPFSNYNPPYLYLLAIVTYLPIPKLIAIKAISVVFDMVLALFAYLILRLKYYHLSLIPTIGALVVFFTPTVIINGSAWGQCDAIYAAFCLGSLYFLLRQRWGWACVFFGLAVAF